MWRRVAEMGQDAEERTCDSPQLLVPAGDLHHPDASLSASAPSSSAVPPSPTLAHSAARSGRLDAPHPQGFLDTWRLSPLPQLPQAAVPRQPPFQLEPLPTAGPAPSSASLGTPGAAPAGAQQEQGPLPKPHSTSAPALHLPTARSSAPRGCKHSQGHRGGRKSFFLKAHRQPRQCLGYKAQCPKAAGQGEEREEKSRRKDRGRERSGTGSRETGCCEPERDREQDKGVERGERRD